MPQDIKPNLNALNSVTLYKHERYVAPEPNARPAHTGLAAFGSPLADDGGLLDSSKSKSRFPFQRLTGSNITSTKGITLVFSLIAALALIAVSAFILVSS